MRNRKRISIMLCVFLTVILLSSCKVSPPSDASEEIAAYAWISQNETGECRMSFDEDNIILSCSLSDEESMKLEGRYFADGDTITVESEDYGTISFKFRLENEKMTIDMYNMSIVFTKE